MTTHDVGPVNSTGWTSLFWTAFNLSANPMMLLGSDRALAGVNDAFLNSFGCGRADALGRKLDSFVAEDSSRRMKRDWRELLRTGRLNGEREMVRADSRRMRAQFAAHHEQVTGGELVLGVLLETKTRPMRCGKAGAAAACGR